jgi:hypothetical protein
MRKQYQEEALCSFLGKQPDCLLRPTELTIEIAFQEVVSLTAIMQAARESEHKPVYLLVLHIHS